MWVFIILLLLLLLIGWVLISPVELSIDTRRPEAVVRWRSIGYAQVWYEEGWQLQFRFLFYRQSIDFSKKTASVKKKKTSREKRKKKQMKRLPQRIINVVKTFRVINWQLAVDTGDYVRNAQLYPLNFVPFNYRHLHINFKEDNYLLLTIRNRPWKIVYAFLWQPVLNK